MTAKPYAIATVSIICMVLPTGMLLLATALDIRGKAAMSYLLMLLFVTAAVVVIQLVAAVKALLQDYPILGLMLAVGAFASVLVPMFLALSLSHYGGLYTFYPL
jgi:hypothetical protein